MIILTNLNIDIAPALQPDSVTLSLTTVNNGRIKHSDHSFSTIAGY